MERTVNRLTTLNIPEESLRSVALSHLAVGESYFFRDREMWEAIPKAVPRFRDLKLLSIGCSWGEEVYTASFVLKSRFKSILGLDIDQSRIEKAMSGVYDRWKLREMRDHEIERYFDKHESLFRVKDFYREGVYFKASSAFQVPLENRYDVLFARRVMIYLSEEGVSELVNKIDYLLKDDGILVLGKGELYWQILEKFEPFPVGRAIFWRKRGKAVSDEMELDMVKVSLSDTNSNDRENLVENLLNAGLYEEALKWSKSLRSDDPRNIDAWKYEILSLAYMGLLDEALEILREAKLRFPGDPEIKRLEMVLR